MVVPVKVQMRYITDHWYHNLTICEMKGIYLIVSVSLSVFFVSVYGDTNRTFVQNYIETTGSIKIEYRYSVTKTATGFTLESSSEIIKEICTTNTAYKCQLWEYSSIENNTQFMAERKDNIIHLVGIVGGQKFDKEAKTFNLPWFQFLGIWNYKHVGVKI